MVRILCECERCPVSGWSGLCSLHGHPRATSWSSIEIPGSELKGRESNLHWELLPAKSIGDLSVGFPWCSAQQSTHRHVLLVYTRVSPREELLERVWGPLLRTEKESAEGESQQR